MQFWFLSVKILTFTMAFSFVKVAGKSMSFETGKMGRQAGGSVVSRTQDTMVRTWKNWLYCFSYGTVLQIVCTAMLTVETRMLTYMYTHAYTHTHTHIHIHTYPPTHTHTHTLTRTYTHTHTHTHIPTHTHSHTHTHTLWIAYSSNNTHTLNPPLLSSPLISCPLLSSLLPSPLLSSPVLSSPLLSCPLLSGVHNSVQWERSHTCGFHPTASRLVRQI